jgi:ABC-type antimicrobial peptide transport system permease subunit
MRTLLPFAYASRNLGRSPARLALSVGGAALVVLLVMAGAGFARGMDRALRSSGTPGNIVLLGAGSEESLERSEISAGTAGVIGASLEGVRTLGGQPLVSSEIHVPLPLRVLGPGERPEDVARAPEEEARRSSRDLAIVRGITPAAFVVHPQVRMTSGRAPEPGANEAILGRSAIRRAGLEEAALRRAIEATGTGATVMLDARPIRVVGTFEAPATVLDGEMWMPLTDLLVLTQRETVSAVIVALEPGADPADVDAFAQRRIDLELSAIGEPEYYAGQSAFYRPVRLLVLASAALVGLGALLGGLNTMYAAFASRAREIGMLQCLGYTRAAIVASMLQESLLAAMSGALIAVGAALLALDGISIEFSMGTFGIVMDAHVVVLGLATGALVGVAGSIAPAVRCLRLPIPSALKSD